MRSVGWRSALVLGLMATAGLSGPAAAQLVRNPDEVRACLCKEQAVAALDDQVKAERNTYDERRQSFEALDKQVQASRAQVNVNNPGDVDAFKRLLEQRDTAADALAGPVTKDYADIVKRYNDAVADYNSSCAGKSFDQDQLNEMKRTLACPRPGS